MNKKKVLYIIFSSSDTAGGGHFYSLKTISKAMQENIDYRILNLGYVNATPLVDEPNAHYIDIKRENFFVQIKKVLSYINEYNPDVLHAFDNPSLFFARTAALFNKKIVIYTKCGGPNGRRLKFIPDSDAHILFSRENFDFFSKYGKKTIPKYFIPNRTAKVETDTFRVNQLREEYDLKNKFILLRISRFNPYYDLSFRQSLNLLIKYLENNDKSVLLFIGKIQDYEYYENLKKLCKDLPVIFITDVNYTHEASQLIDITNVLIGTGRGVMEASSLDKTIFCPVKDSDLPIVLNVNTLEKLFLYNFSERVKINKKFIEKENSKIMIDNIVAHTFPFYEEYFSIKNATTKYLEIYNTSSKKRFRIINYLLHLLLFFK
ncbi:MAG: hypothetical protein PHS38_08705 [Bacteroidales bacterium]|nr:hypothetical protein [Bacteroidales bacterium]